MGDSARFRLMADLVRSRFPERSSRIADVACGKGQLRAALHQLGYGKVESWDKRPKLAKGRGYHYALFDYQNAPRGFDLVLGMHPDQGTDHIILYAVKHHIPFVVCPCCILPSASEFQGDGYQEWMRHLTQLAVNGGMDVEQVDLTMAGRKRVLIGTWEAAERREERSYHRPVPKFF